MKMNRCNYGLKTYAIVKYHDFQFFKLIIYKKRGSVVLGVTPCLLDSFGYWRI